MANEKLKKSGHTIAELIVGSAIAILAFVVLFYISFTLQDNIDITSGVLGISERGRFAIDRISKHIREAKSIVSLHGAYSTDNDTIVLELPSINASGDVIDPDKYFDYVIYTLQSDNILRIVDANVASSRKNSTETVTGNVDTLLFSSQGVGLSSYADKSSINTVTVKIITRTISARFGRQNEIITSVSLRNK